MTAPLNDLVDLLSNQRVLPILRSRSAEDAVATGLACLQEGLSCVELTTSIPDVLEATEALTREGMTIGVGTLRSATELTAVATAGARFAVSYFQPDGFVQAGLRNGLAPIPGTLTPTEIQSASTAGAEIIKLFPGWQSHPRIIADLAPLIGPMHYIVTGGITPTSMAEWLTAGVLAVGVGRDVGSVADDGIQTVRENLQGIAERAGEFRNRAESNDQVE